MATGLALLEPALEALLPFLRAFATGTSYLLLHKQFLILVGVGSIDCHFFMSRDKCYSSALAVAATVLLYFDEADLNFRYSESFKLRFK